MKISGRERMWFRVLVAALALYTIKSIFVGADIDEAYGVTLGYRLVQGDRLVWDMWEPHQTSAIFTALFIRLILLLTGGSLQFMTVLLRVCFFLVQIGITLYLCRCLKECLPFLSRWEQILFAMVYYITTPKCNYVPEYSNLHMWFSTLLVLFLMQYCSSASRNHGRSRYLVLAGGMLACDVLAYPGMVLLYPFCAGMILWKSNTGRRRLGELAAFTLPCVLGAGVFVGYLFSYMSLQDMALVLPAILGDGSHQIGIAEKLGVWGAGIGEIVLMTAGCGAVAVLVLIVGRRFLNFRRHGVFSPEDGGTAGRDWIVELVAVWFVVQTVFQILCWLDSDYNSGYPQIAYVALPLFGWLCAGRCERRERTGLLMIGFSLVNYLALNLFSNWKPACLNVYLVAGLLGGLLCLRQYFLEKRGEAGLKLIRGICVLFLFTQVFGRCLLMIGGDEGSSMTFQVRGFSREGVRGGIFTSYMNSYRYNNNYELFPEIVPEGGMVLYLGPSAFYYMMGDCRVAAPSTISTPEYDERFAMYYELHPERFPDVVVMESCYGDVSYFAEDAYIFTWLEEEFKPAQVEDYPYVRVYRREIR
ncbi:MAG: hypothetical protein K2H41_07715 [Acetatifactor sp.]|nr:hypothetical protein [Acetatifactor sp.]